MVLVSAAAVYLFYYVLVSGGGHFARLSASALCLYFIFEWSRVFYRLGRGD